MCFTSAVIEDVGSSLKMLLDKEIGVVLIECFVNTQTDTGIDMIALL